MPLYESVCDSHMYRSQRRTLGMMFHCSLLYFLESGSLLNPELGWHPVSPGIILTPSTLTVLGYSLRQPHYAFYECWGFELRSLYFFSRYSLSREMSPQSHKMQLWCYYFSYVFTYWAFHTYIQCILLISILPFLLPNSSQSPSSHAFQLHNFFYIFHNPLSPVSAAHLCMCVDPNTGPLGQSLKATSFKEPPLFLSLSPRSHQLATAPWLEVKTWAPPIAVLDLLQKTMAAVGLCLRGPAMSRGHFWSRLLQPLALPCLPTTSFVMVPES